MSSKVWEVHLQILGDREHQKFEQYVSELQKLAARITELHTCDSSPDELCLYVLQNIGRSEVLTINHKNDANNVKRAGNPQAMFTFAIGGNIVSRGLTFERLLTFYFSRTVKGKLQQNTYIQRARMFGNRPYSAYFELCVPETLFSDWATVFQDHELSLRLARAGVYQHIQSTKVAVVDAGAIDKTNVTMEKSERAVGAIFTLTNDLEQLILNQDIGLPITALENMIASGAIDAKSLPISLINYLREVAKQDESDVIIVTRTTETGARVLQNIERYSDGDTATITRSKGGIIHAMLNKSEEYAKNNHFILPIRNEKGEARFLYKSKIGHTILQNLRVHRPTL